MRFEQWNPGECRTYFVGCESTKEAALVDPVLGPVERYITTLQSGGWTLRYAIDTHTHADHLSGCRLLAERTGAEYVMHKKAGASTAEHILNDGTTLPVGDVTLTVVETPGHTKDSVSLLAPGRLMTGDWLFLGGAGRTDLPGGDAGEHWDSLTRVIPTLDLSTVVCPGHDYQNRTVATLEEENRTNANLRARSREDYVRWLASAAQPTPEWMVETIRANQEGLMDPSIDLMPADAVSACMCAPAPSLGVTDVSVDEARAIQIENDGRLLLDVRQPDEYHGPLGHVPGALLIPLPELPARLSELEAYRGKTIVTICRSGGRSAQAAGILMNAGHDRILNMAGGTQAWVAKGFPVER